MESFFSSDYGFLFSILVLLIGIGMGYLGIKIANDYAKEQLDKHTNRIKKDVVVETEQQLINRLNLSLRAGWLEDGKALSEDRKKLLGY